tara:strand:- start:94 stop:369 length:276 start_codon:yes stop_codon:yes gene_type:complete
MNTKEELNKILDEDPLDLLGPSKIDSILDTARALMTEADVAEIAAALTTAATAWQAALDADTEAERVKDTVLRRILDRVPASVIAAAQATN